MHHILIVEDGRDFQLIIRKALSDDMRVTAVETVKDAILALSRETFDLIVLDITLPDGDGFQICSHLQGQERLRKVPVFFLTAREEVSNKVAAFALGADDYIVKPFDPMEFRARIEGKLRKVKSSESSDQTLVKGPLRIQFLSQRAFLSHAEKEIELNLTPLEFKILALLARNADKVMSRDQILQAVWGNHVRVFDRTVDTHISSLRKKMAPCGHYIQSILGSGYSFTLSHAASSEKKVAS